MIENSILSLHSFVAVQLNIHQIPQTDNNDHSLSLSGLYGAVSIMDAILR